MFHYIARQRQGLKKFFVPKPAALFQDYQFQLTISCIGKLLWRKFTSSSEAARRFQHGIVEVPDKRHEDAGLQSMQELLLDVIDSIHDGYGWDEGTSSIIRVLLYSSLKMARKHIVRHIDLNTLCNLLDLCNVVDEFIFFMPLSSQDSTNAACNDDQDSTLGLHLFDDGTSKDFMLARLVLTLLDLPTLHESFDGTLNPNLTSLEVRLFKMVMKKRKLYTSIDNILMGITRNETGSAPVKELSMVSKKILRRRHKYGHGRGRHLHTQRRSGKSSSRPDNVASYAAAAATETAAPAQPRRSTILNFFTEIVGMSKQQKQAQLQVDRSRALRQSFSGGSGAKSKSVVENLNNPHNARDPCQQLSSMSRSEEHQPMSNKRETTSSSVAETHNRTLSADRARTLDEVVSKANNSFPLFMKKAPVDYVRRVSGHSSRSGSRLGSLIAMGTTRENGRIHVRHSKQLLADDLDDDEDDDIERHIEESLPPCRASLTKRAQVVMRRASHVQPMHEFSTIMRTPQTEKLDYDDDESIEFASTDDELSNLDAVNHLDMLSSEEATPMKEFDNPQTYWKTIFSECDTDRTFSEAATQTMPSISRISFP